MKSAVLALLILLASPGMAWEQTHPDAKSEQPSIVAEQVYPTGDSAGTSGALQSTATSCRGPVAAIVDSSDSMGPFAASVLTETRALITALQDGTRFRLVSVDSEVHSVFSGVMDSQTRKEALSEIGQLAFTIKYTDLGEGLAEAQRWFEGTGFCPGTIVLFTDGEPFPKRNSKFAKYSFEELINDPLLIGQQHRLLIRLYKSQSNLQIHRSNVKVFAGPPQFDSLFAAPVSERNEKPRPQAGLLRKWKWRMAIVMGAVLFIVIVWSAGRTLYLRVKQSRLLAKREAALAPVEKDTPRTPPEPVPAPRTRFAVGFGERELYVEPDRKQSLVGGVVYADLFINGCPRIVLLELTADDHLQIENVGEGLVKAGKLPIPPGAHEVLPMGRIELALGEYIVIVRPESFFYQEVPVTSSAVDAIGGNNDIS